MKHLDLGFVGFGLIGGSIARSLKKNRKHVTIRVYSRRKNTDLETGVKEGVIDEILYAVDEHFSSCDIIFLCAPVKKNEDYLPLLKPVIKPECILTDVGSVKGEICRAAARHGLAHCFIGGHPMAGSEKTGYANSTDTLLENAYYLLTPTSDTAPEKLTALQELIDDTGALSVVLTPKKHDEITAVISHVPHIIAVSLVNLAKQNDTPEENMKAFAAGGFKDITRIASSSPAMWQDICLANQKSICHFLAEYEKKLSSFREMIENGDGDGIFRAFEESGEYRNSIPNKKNGIIARSFELYVNVDDRAGAIASITSILSEKDISIRDISIIHNREFADGVLKLDLYTQKDALLAEKTLTENGFCTVERK